MLQLVNEEVNKPWWFSKSAHYKMKPIVSHSRTLTQMKGRRIIPEQLNICYLYGDKSMMLWDEGVDVERATSHLHLFMERGNFRCDTSKKKEV